MSQPQNDADFSLQPVFVNGREGYACYRIPSIIRLGNGNLLAVAEGRLANCGDHNGIIRVVGKISQDRGRTWGGVFTIARNILPDGTEHVAQNPAPALDMMDPDNAQGRAIIIYNKTEFGEQFITGGSGVRRACSIESFDHGRSWVNERDITTEVHKPLKPTYTAVYADAAERYQHPEDWRMNFPATGHGIQLRGGLRNSPATRGRLFYCAKLTKGDRSVRHGQNYAYWSEDHGRSWTIGGVSAVLGSSEAMAVELESGDIMVNFRNNTGAAGAGVHWRGVMIHQFDEDGNILMAATHRDDEGLPDPIVQGSIQRYTWSDEAEYGNKSRILFSNPASQRAREKMTVRLSYDEGRTWPVAKLVDSGPSAYGDLTVLDDMRIGLLYERGNQGGIVFARFTLDWLSAGQDSLSG